VIMSSVIVVASKVRVAFATQPYPGAPW
jgi:hypothetical protein